MIKKIPVCPFCEKDMIKEINQALIPTMLSTQYVETDDHKRYCVKTTDTDVSSKVITEYDKYRLWRCEGCGFVALWKAGGV